MINDSNTRTLQVAIGKMDCPDCGLKIEKRLHRVKGVESAEVNFLTARLTVKYQPIQINPRAISREVEKLGYTVKDPESPEKPGPGSFFQKPVFSTFLSGGLTVGGVISSFLFSSQISTVFYLMAVFLGGYPIARKGLLSLKQRITDMNVLMTLAVFGAVLLRDYLEGASVVFLFSLAQWLETRSVDRSRKAIGRLIDYTPVRVTVSREGADQRVDGEQVKAGERVIVRPGEILPFDGKIVKGISSVNQASMTGESLPVDKKERDEVYAGTLNLTGVLEIEVTHLWKESRMARIIHLVEESSGRKASSQRFVDLFSKYYTPWVISFAVFIAVAPPLFFHENLNTWFYRALVLVVIACPCALVISTPVTIISGLSAAARKGILIKGGLFLEELGRIKTFVFDKTGTLTTGIAGVKEVIPFSGTAESLIRIAASLEKHAKHPVAGAIVEYANRMGTPELPLKDFQSFPGLGAKGVLAGETYFIGNHRFFEEQGFCSEKIESSLFPLEAQGKTTVLIGNEREVLGIIAVSDSLRPETAQSLRELRTEGVENISMMTGDNAVNASLVASRIGLDEVYAEMMPDEKANTIGQLRKKFEKVAMVGDGINDAPALAAATVGIAMGEKGTEVSMETADVVLMSDNLLKLPFAVRLGKQTLRLIKQNVALAIGIKAVFLILAIAGLSTLWMAVAADMGVSLLVIANGMRITFLRPS
ncbi:MAG: cation-translocating P-type ATPase [Nitrospirae bacterium]|nr:cation-translocating P-type ATPase [Nitrospirota bacterium]MBI3351797.1 cation-translocating P-type ATPase [Nitrospirota bacterium]